MMIAQFRSGQTLQDALTQVVVHDEGEQPPNWQPWMQLPLT
jgi:hypothetical protein